jgi:hypothetical protein
METMRRIGLVGAFAALSLLAGCGDDAGSSGAPDSEAAITTVSADTTPAVTPDAPSSTAAPVETIPIPPIESGVNPEVDAVVAAYTTVFDSSVPFEVKAPFLVEAEALRPAVEEYAEQGEPVGGIKFVPTSVTIVDQQAAILFDVFVGTKRQSSSLPGSAEKHGDVWKVTRIEFCNSLAAADTACPAP